MNRPLFKCKFTKENLKVVKRGIENIMNNISKKIPTTRCIVSMCLHGDILVYIGK